MSNQDIIPSDPLGLRAGGESFKILVECATTFLDKIAGPAAEEFGLFLQDKVRSWRLRNIVQIAQKTERIVNQSGGLEGKAVHPRLLSRIIEEASWVDDDKLQELWAGLLASSCTEEAKDNGNLIFVNLLSQLTPAQGKLLKHCSEKVEKWLAITGFFQAKQMKLTSEELTALTGLQDIHIIDLEIDHLRSIGLVDGGIDIHSGEAEMGPTDLALHMFVRCQGSTQAPPDYFGLVHQEP